MSDFYNRMDAALDSMAEQIGSLGQGVATILKEMDCGARGDAEWSAGAKGNGKYIVSSPKGKTYVINGASSAREAIEQAKKQAEGRGDGIPHLTPTGAWRLGWDRCKEGTPEYSMSVLSDWPERNIKAYKEGYAACKAGEKRK